MVTQQSLRGAFFCHCEADEASRSNLMEGLRMTGKIVSGFMGLTI